MTSIFLQGNIERAKLNEFNSNNTQLLTVEETKAKDCKLELYTGRDG